MDTKVASILGGCIVLAALIIAFVPQLQNSSEIGRYQLVFPDDSNSFVLDTKTGRLWGWQNKSRTNGVANWENLLPNLTKEEEKGKD